MIGIKVKITRFISYDQPGLVECKFRDAWNKEFTIEEKIPVVTKNYLDENSEYPQDGFVACERIKKWEDKDGRKIVTIDTEKPWGIETIDGLTQFDILQKDLLDV